MTPDLGQCLIFEASDISFHGVLPLKCPDDVARRSFAAYYYTPDRRRPAYAVSTAPCFMLGLTSGSGN